MASNHARNNEIRIEMNPNLKTAAIDVLNWIRNLQTLGANLSAGREGDEHVIIDALEHAILHESEPSFELAEQIVKTRIIQETAKLVARKDSKCPHIYLSSGGWFGYADISKATLKSDSLDALIASIPTPVQATAELIAKLESELAELRRRNA